MMADAPRSPFRPAERPRRFYTAVAAAPLESGFGVTLDARALRTPAGVRLMLPRLALAELVAAEWSAQEGVIDYGLMPATRLAFTAADRLGRRERRRRRRSPVRPERTCSAISPRRPPS